MEREKTISVDEIALDIIICCNSYLSHLKNKGTKKAKEKYLQYAPQVLEMICRYESVF